LESLLGDIQKALRELHEKSDAAKGSFDAKAVKACLVRLKQALETLEARAMSSAIDDLLKLELTDNISAAIQKISENILMAEYDEALEITESLLNEVK